MPEFVFTLTPAESKRLLALAVAQLPEVQAVKATGRIVIGNGSTNAYVAQDLFVVSLEKKRFPSGLVTAGVACHTPANNLEPLYFLAGSQVIPPTEVPRYEYMRQFMEQMKPGDVFIKGANAIDREGNLGILLAQEAAGTMGVALPIMAAQGIAMVAPVGLEKMIPSVIEASRMLPGIHKSRYSLGHGVGYMVITNALVITEIEALRILSGTEALQLAAGGVGGSEGAVVLLARGSGDQVDKAFSLIQSIKGEKKFEGWKQKCSQCSFVCNWRLGE